MSTLTSGAIMAIYFGCCWFINLKMVDFYLGDSIISNAQIAPDRTIFIKISKLLEILSPNQKNKWSVSNLKNQI